MSRLVLIVLAAVLLTACSGPQPADDARAICQQFVQDRLTSPGSAKFSPSDKTAAYQVGEAWIVMGYVDSQNGFGAMLRSTYDCRTTPNGNDRWLLERLIITER
jgi:hypothetical protein